MMLSLFIALGLLVVGILLLLRGADWFVDGVGDLAQALGVSALVLGVVLAGLEPEEMLTAALASARGASALAEGNIIGTNITMVTAALGLSALINPIVIDRNVRRQALIATLVSIIPIILLIWGVVTQFEGMLLLIVFVSYTIFLVWTDQHAMERMVTPEVDDNQKPRIRRRLHWKPVLLTISGLAAMAGGGPAIVEGALRLAQTMGISQGTIGTTIVSLGTGAEMIVLGISTAHKKRSDVLIGGVLGSFAYNLLATLGLAATIRPLPGDAHVTFIALPVMVGVHLVLLVLIWYGKIPRVIGGLLMVVYVAYLMTMVLI